jgi:hypothetical protein
MNKPVNAGGSVSADAATLLNASAQLIAQVQVNRERDAAMEKARLERTISDLIAEMCILKDHANYLEREVHRLGLMNSYAEERLDQVDEVLAVNWIAVKGGDYRKALHDLITWEIQTHDDPAVSPEAGRRKAELESLRRELAEQQAELQRFRGSQ